MDLEPLFVAATLALGPSPIAPESPQMTAYQLDLIRFFGNAGVKGLDDHEFRRLLLAWFFAWEAQQIKDPIDTHIVGPS